MSCDSACTWESFLDADGMCGGVGLDVSDTYLFDAAVFSQAGDREVQLEESAPDDDSTVASLPAPMVNGDDNGNEDGENFDFLQAVYKPSRPYWGRMDSWCKYAEVVVFSHDSLVRTSDVEAATLLAKTFPSCNNTEMCVDTGRAEKSLQEVVDGISQSSNYSVTQMVRVQNIQRADMHDDFKRHYAIEHTATVYHGTTGESAISIARTGFRGACSMRSKFGKGIYTTSNIWEALAYAHPDPLDGNKQTFLVACLLVGPTTIGSVEMVDFGNDESGSQILTTTNPEGTIFCAAYGDQLLATYRITVQFNDLCHTTDAMRRMIRIYNPVVRYFFFVHLHFAKCSVAYYVGLLNCRCRML